MYGNFIRNWEIRCHERDIDKRTVRPFDWGLEFLSPQFVRFTPEAQAASLTGSGAGRINGVNGLHTNGHLMAAQQTPHPKEIIDEFTAQTLEASQQFFTPATVTRDDFDFDGFWLRFPSGVITPYPQNNLVHARWYPAGDEKKAVIVSPQWNGDEQAHVAICKGLNRFGISALRLSLPYHDRRMPAELSRADYMVSANIGRTIQSVQQAVQDVRRCADWLQLRGVQRIGVMGTSIGSCTSFLAFVHDERLETGVFNHVSSYFGDVVWTGITTAHIRKSLEEFLTREELQRFWITISPAAYLHRSHWYRRKALMISAKYDLTFPWELSQVVFQECEKYGAGIDKVVLPCGHYTSGKTPFKFLDGYHIINYFRKTWN